MRKKSSKRTSRFFIETLEPRIALAITPRILPDSYENNDTLATARSLGEVSGSKTWGSLSLDPMTSKVMTMDDSFDWYSFTMPLLGNNLSNVRIDFKHSQGDLDLSLYTTGGTRLRNSNGITDSETFSIKGLAAGTYKIRVSGFKGALNPDYSLTITTTARIVPPVTPKFVDLVGGYFNAPASGIWGSPITVQSKVKNNGTAGTAFGVGVSYYLSSDTTFDPIDDVLLQLTNFTTALNFQSIPAKSLTAAKTTQIVLPTSLPVGFPVQDHYYILMYTDPDNLIEEVNPATLQEFESNNVATYGSNIDLDVITIFNPKTPTPATLFHIDINPTGMTPQQVQYFKLAAARWEKVIVGDLQDVIGDDGEIIDDLQISAVIEKIDGPGGVLANANPEEVRPDSGLAYTGSMRFDQEDVVSLEADGSFLNVITHEMGHVLGLLSDNFGVLQGVGTDKPVYTGKYGVAAFNKISGLKPVKEFPIEADGGPGTAYVHWDDALMQTELMTGFSGPGNYQPLSIVTVGYLQDIGYKVNYAGADHYLLQEQPKTVTVLPIPSPEFPVGGTGIRRLSSLRAGESGSIAVSSLVNVTPLTNAAPMNPGVLQTTNSKSINVTMTSKVTSPSATSSLKNSLQTNPASSNQATTAFVNRDDNSDTSSKLKELDDIFGKLSI